MTLTRTSGLLAVLTCAAVVGACGSDDSGSGAEGAAPPSAPSGQSSFFNQDGFDQQTQWAEMKPEGPDGEPWAQYIDAEMVDTSEYAAPRQRAAGWRSAPTFRPGPGRAPGPHFRRPFASAPTDPAHRRSRRTGGQEALRGGGQRDIWEHRSPLPSTPRALSPNFGFVHEPDNGHPRTPLCSSSRMDVDATPSFSQRVLVYVGMLTVPLVLGVACGKGAIALTTDGEVPSRPASHVGAATPRDAGGFSSTPMVGGDHGRGTASPP